MSFEKILEDIGERLDKGVENIKKTAQKEAKSFRKHTVKSSDKMMRKFIKIAEETQKKAKLDKKGLSSFEEKVGNIAISIANIIEEIYKETVEKIMATKKERKTKYGIIGFGLNLNLISKKRATLCKDFLKQVEKKIRKKIKGKRDVLKSIVESSSNNSLELYTYCTYKELTKKKGNFTKQKEIIKKYLLTKEEKRCIKNG